MDAQREIQPTGSQLCDADNVSAWFWDIIRRADKDRTKLEGILRELPIDDIRRFAVEFHDASSALWSKPYTGYLTYRSEDDIADVSYWIVSQGKDMYVDTCAHSEKIATYEAVAHAD